jgi:hypothetical protein
MTSAVGGLVLVWWHIVIIMNVSRYFPGGWYQGFSVCSGIVIHNSSDGVRVRSGESPFHTSGTSFFALLWA